MDIYEVIRQDFAAATAAFEEADFSQLNMYSNRLMGNALFGNQKQYGLIGFFLKSIATDFLKGGVNTELETRLRPIASTFISRLHECLQPTTDLNGVWEGYFAYKESSRKLHMNSVERRVYRDNVGFTKQAFSYLADELLIGDAVFHEHGLVSTAVLVEIDRAIRNHGAEQRELVLQSLVVAFDRLIGYMKVAFSSDAQGLRSTISPWLQRIKQWTSHEERLPYDEASEILCDMVFEWRRMYIRYMELGRAVPREERKIELPLQAKQKIGDTIAEALQKDLPKPTRGKKHR
jgi:hypothetical protein